jgi:trehalose-phosphatase
VREAITDLLRAAHTKIAIVTGRPLTELDSLLQPPPGLDLWGAHGWERRDPAGTSTVWKQPEYGIQALIEAHSRIQQSAPPELLEIKPGAVVIHTRAVGDDEHERIRHAVHAHWTPLLANGEGLKWREFNRGFEFRLALRTKGTVVETLRSEAPQGSHLAYLGDDLTDEDAFVVLPPPDWAILVSGRPRESHAPWWLPAPDGVINFLQRWTSQFP